MSISTWLVLLESVELHSRQMFTALTWPQVQLTLLVLWWGAVKPSADRNDGQRGSESSRELIQSWLGKLTFLFRKVQLSIQISFILTEPASLLTDSWPPKKTKVSDRTSRSKNPVAKFSGLGFLWCHRICLGIWMTTSVSVKNEHFCETCI